MQPLQQIGNDALQIVALQDLFLVVTEPAQLTTAEIRATGAVKWMRELEFGRFVIPAEFFIISDFARCDGVVTIVSNFDNDIGITTAMVDKEREQIKKIALSQLE